MKKLFLSCAFCFILVASANAGILVDAASNLEAKQAEISNKISSVKDSAEAKNAVAKEETSSTLAAKKKNLEDAKNDAQSSYSNLKKAFGKE